MKGIVFTEFLEMVEQEFGYRMVDKIIQKSNLPSGGVYTSIGTYDHAEIVQLLMNLSEEAEMEASILLKEFGKYLFDTFLSSYPVFFHGLDNSFDFLASIDGHIHVEVKKLYPDATLPRFSSEVIDGKMIMIYKSDRKMSDLAVGLIEKTIQHFKENKVIEKKNIQEDGSEVKITIYEP